MPWELVVLNYDGQPPRHYKDSDKNRELPLGTLDEVREHISTVLHGTEWHEEPPLIELMKATGSTSWLTWDPDWIANASKPRLKAIYQEGDLWFEMFGFEQEGPLRSLLLDVRGNQNPLPLLRRLVEPTGWSIAEMGKDGEFLDFREATQERWNGWSRFLSDALNQE
jgi:hypothetical protein